MRLTLRTLLAYLDDLLEPAETKEIGEKIKNSKEATDLIAHIQEVIRRRRLTAPEIDGPDAGLDPNTVAEYLNNTLASEQVVDVEKVFLESDVHLAEVAATQQIMTQVLGDPIEPNQELLERMYALLPSTVSSAVSGTPSQTSLEGNGQPADERPETNTGRVDPSEESVSKPKSFEEGIPDYLKGPPIGRRLFSYGAVVVVALLWIALLWFGNPLAKSKQKSDVPLDNQVALGEPSDKFGDDDDFLPEPEKKITPKNAPNTSDNNKQPVNPKPPVENVNKPMPPVIAKIPVVVAVAPIVPPVIPPQNRPLPAKTLLYTSNSGILLRFDRIKNEWFVMPSRAIVQAGEIIATPQPFASTIKIGDSLAEVTLLGQSSLRTALPTLNTSWGISVIEGRVLIETKLTKETFPKEGVLLSLASHQQTWKLKVTSPETTCGIEVLPNQPTGLEQKPVANPYRVNLYVATGSVQIIDTKGTSLNFAAGSSTPLIAEFAMKKLPEANENKTATTPQLITLPEWLDYNKTTPSRITRKYARLFEKEFDIDQSVALNVPPLLSDSRPKIAELAVECLSLTRNIPALVQALAQSEHEEARLAAMIGLRNWLGTTPDSSKLLHQELAKVFPKDDADAVYRLLWGYTKDDATDKAASTQLVLWLGNNHVVIRELAFYYVQQLAGQKHSYHPLSAPAQRNAAIRRWRDHVEKKGGLQK